MKRFLPVLLLVAAACGDIKNPNGMPDQPTSDGAPQLVTRNPPKPDSAAATTEKAVMPADSSVAGAWLILDGGLRAHDAATLNQLIDPEYGLWVLEQANGQPVVTRVATADQFRDQHQQPLFALSKRLLPSATPKPVAKLPAPTCPAGTYSVSGSFAGPSTEFRALDFWKTATLHHATRNQCQAAQGRCVRGVLQTNTGYQFHFSKSAGAGGRWKLVFIDLRGACPK